MFKLKPERVVCSVKIRKQSSFQKQNMVSIELHACLRKRELMQLFYEKNCKKITCIKKISLKMYISDRLQYYR